MAELHTEIVERLVTLLAEEGTTIEPAKVADALGWTSDVRSRQRRRKTVGFEEVMEAVRHWNQHMPLIEVRLGGTSGFEIGRTSSLRVLGVQEGSPFLDDPSTSIVGRAKAARSTVFRALRSILGSGYDRVMCLRASARGGLLETQASGHVVAEVARPDVDLISTVWFDATLDQPYMEMLARLTQEEELTLYTPKLTGMLRTIYERDGIARSSVGLVHPFERSIWYVSAVQTSDDGPLPEIREACASIREPAELLERLIQEARDESRYGGSR